MICRRNSGKWYSVHSRFRRWTLSGVWESLFNALADDPDFEYVHDRRHDLEGPRRCSRRKRGAQAHGIGRSKGGLTTKVHACVDALGNPLRIEISGRPSP